MSYVAVYVLEGVSSVGHGQVSVEDKLQPARSLVIVKTILAGLKGKEAVFPDEGWAAKDNRRV